MKRFLSASIFFSLTLVTAPFTAADGPSRPIRQAEIEFFKMVQPVLLKVFPPMPENWAASDLPRAEIPKTVSPDQETFPMRQDIHARWYDQEKKAKYDADLVEVARKAAAAWNAPDPEQKKLEEEQKRLLKAMEAAFKSKNMTEAQEIGKQIEEVQKKLRPLLEAKSKKTDELVRAVQPHDADLDAAIKLNSFYETFYLDRKIQPGFTQEPDIAGARVFRIENGGHVNENRLEGTTVAVLGPWTVKREEGTISLESKPKHGIPYTAVQTIFIRVRAEKSRAVKFLQALDWHALKSLTTQK